MDAFFASYHAHRPVNATFIGEHDFDHRLPNCGENGLGDLLADTRELLDRSSALGDAAEGRYESIDRRLAQGFLESQEWELRSRHFQRGNPSYYTGEAVFSLIGLFLTEYAPAPPRAEAAVARMNAMPALLRQAQANVRSAPVDWTRRALRECEGADALLADGLPRLLADFGGSLSSSLEQSFEKAAVGARRAFAEHRVWLESDLLARDHDEYAAGPEAFDLYLRKGHFLNDSASEILRYAEEQMEEAEALTAKRAGDFGAATPAEALAGLAELHPDAAGYEARYGKIWDDVRRISDERDLLSWPDFPIRYVSRPEWTRKAAPYLYFLFYRSPAAVNRPDVHDYLIAPLPDAEDDRDAFLRANNDSVIKLNHVVHHGGIGHHVQNWHAFRAESRIGRMAAVDCASRIAMFCGGTMAEGWACYATDLAAEFGALTPLEEYAEAYSRVRMAARAVVDIRLHRGEMSMSQAADFYHRRAGMSETAARGEAVKNSMFPCAALMYLMGTDGVHRLRSEMASRAGSDFDLGRFHDQFLSYGSIPVSLIAEDMTKGLPHAE